jgi:hypothetical protein
VQGLGFRSPVHAVADTPQIITEVTKRESSTSPPPEVRMGEQCVISPDVCVPHAS